MIVELIEPVNVVTDPTSKGHKQLVVLLPLNYWYYMLHQQTIHENWSSMQNTIMQQFLAHKYHCLI